MKVAVYARNSSKALLPQLKDFFEALSQYGFNVYLYHNFLDFLKTEFDFLPEHTATFYGYADLDPETDFVISIGGDGTFLDTVSLVRDTKIPVIGINSGKLGFLASISKEDITSAVSSLYHGNYSIEKRSLLQLESEDELFNNFNVALNDMSIQKKGSEMITVHVYIDEVYLNTYWADGLIVATPTGSTAYSLSVGGPIVMPNSNNFIISPISPHNLTIRPIVIPDNGIVTLRPEGRCSRYLVSMDHHSRVIEKPISINVRKAGFSMHVLRLNDVDYYSTLRNKLMWGMDKRN